ncbi:MAG: VPDSG-CTERM sorting domain-containing protein [Chthoniobacterales bacterium]
MNKLALTAALALVAIFNFTPQLSAQTASFVYTGVPTGNLQGGDTFTVGVSVLFTAGGSVTNLIGVTYWMAQISPTSAFPLTLINRDTTGSPFTDLQSPSLQYPQILDAINRNPNGTTTATDLGAAIGAAASPLGSGLHFVANLTFRLVNNAVAGTYLFGNTFASTPGAAGRFSVVSDNGGHTAGISSSTFRISVVPDSGSTVLLLLAGLLPLALVRRVATAAR